MSNIGELLSQVIKGLVINELILNTHKNQILGIMSKPTRYNKDDDEFQYKALEIEMVNSFNFIGITAHEISHRNA